MAGLVLGPGDTEVDNTGQLWLDDRVDGKPADKCSYTENKEQGAQSSRSQ